MAVWSLRDGMDDAPVGRFMVIGAYRPMRVSPHPLLRTTLSGLGIFEFDNERA